MKLMLQIPNKENLKEIEKVYEVESFDLPFGVVDNLLSTLDFEEVDNLTLGKQILKSMKEIKPLMLYIFPGLTEEELSRVGIRQLIPVIMNIFVEMKDQLSDDLKNVMAGMKK